MEFSQDTDSRQCSVRLMRTFNRRPMLVKIVNKNTEIPTNCVSFVGHFVKQIACIHHVLLQRNTHIRSRHTKSVLILRRHIIILFPKCHCQFRDYMHASCSVQFKSDGNYISLQHGCDNKSHRLSTPSTVCGEILTQSTDCNLFARKGNNWNGTAHAEARRVLCGSLRARKFD